SATETATFYNGIVDRVMASVRRIPALSSDASTAGALRTYVDFVEFKSQFSRERTNTVAVLTEDSFGPDSLRRHIEALAAQENFLTAVDAWEPASRQWITGLKTAPEFDQVRKVRAILKDKSSDGAFGVAPADWVVANARAADRLRTVEIDISSNI